jgi:hypothetical protein
MKTILMMSLLILFQIMGGEKGQILWDAFEYEDYSQISKVPPRFDPCKENNSDKLLVHYPIHGEYPKPNSLKTPYLDNSFAGFKEALAFRESGGEYSAVNSLGYVGKYQFGAGTLEVLGIREVERFLQDAELQEKTFLAHLVRNKWLLRKEILAYKSHKINGLEITESGVLAAAHLAGAGNVKKYLRSRGRSDVVDAYGTKLSHYMKEFSGFDLSDIPARRIPLL